MSRPSPTLALIRFHCNAGVRVALRGTVPLAGGVVAAVVLSGSALTPLVLVNRLFFPPSVSLMSAALAVASAVAGATWVGPRVTHGFRGWMRHLPASGVDHRRAASAGIAMALSPLVLVLLAGGLMTLTIHPATTLPRLVGMVVLAWCAASASLSGTRHAIRGLNLLAGVMAVAGSWWLMLGAVVVAVAADAVAGPMVARTKLPAARHRPRSPRSAVVSTVAGQWTMISLRSLRWRIVTVWGTAALVLVPAMLFVSHNELSSTQRGIAVRLACLLAVVVVMATLAEALAKRRPPWGWSRSLPLSATTRVNLDAALLSTAMIPALAACLVLRSGGVLPLVVATTLYLAFRGAAAVRQPFGIASSPAGYVMAEGLITAVLVTLVPSAAIGLVVMAPLALRWAAASERNTRIGRWDELAHCAAGDGQSRSQS